MPSRPGWALFSHPFSLVATGGQEWALEGIKINLKNMGLGPPALSVVVKCGRSLWKGLGGEGWGEKGEVCTHRQWGGSLCYGWNSFVWECGP